MKLSRRQLLVGGVGAGLASCGPAILPPSPAQTARWLDGSILARGHRVRTPLQAPSSTITDRADVVIVGGGAAGLSAAWRLRHAGFAGRVVLVELADQLGGTSLGGPRWPLGAHYLVMPSVEAGYLRVMLADLGVITGFTAEGRPRYHPEMVCFAPEERVWVAGTWEAGRWPSLGASREDQAQWQDLGAQLSGWLSRRGADGRPAFAIPVAESSEDPAFRALDQRSMAQWLDEQGYDSPRVRWVVRHACADDYGTELEDTSAWAGLHYFASRRADPADPTDTDVLTWPQGNAWLIHALRQRIRGVEVTTGAVVRQVEAGSAPRVVVERIGAGENTISTETIHARHVILAVPSRVADRLVSRPAGPRPDQSPWLVAVLAASRFPVGRGVMPAWDSVMYQGEGVGYVWGEHQRLASGGAAVLSAYFPKTGAPAAERARLQELSAEEAAESVMAALRPAHADLDTIVSRIELMRWGHGTARPVPGFLDVLPALTAPLDGVSFAHTDQSGISLFEEASFHGVRAAEEALTALGHPQTPLIRHQPQKG